MSRTIMIMAGGTGGHIFPALSVAEELRRADWNVVWLGNRKGMEGKLVPGRGYTMAWIRFGAVRGKGWLRKILLPLDLLIAFWQSARAIFAHRPDVVLGMGGYVAFPGGMMASLFNRPLIIHEQNSVPGLTNRILARLADRVLTGFPGVFSAKFKPEWTGNPVRAEISGLPDPDTRYLTRSGAMKILVIGGSQGARILNTVVPAALARMPACMRPEVTHQAGAAQVDQARDVYRQHGVDAQVVPFIEDIAACYGNADLVICRAGAGTIAEISCAGLASVLVPYPHAVDDHQTANARFLADRGAAVLIPQAQFTPDHLVDVLSAVTRQKLLSMARAARAAGKPSAARVAATICMELAHAA